MKQKLLLTFLFSTITLNVSSQTSVATVTTTSSVMSNPSYLFGITFDARTGMTGKNGPIGYFDSSGNMIPEIETFFGDFPISTMRYPANGIQAGFDWKKSVGLPANLRPTQNILGSAGAAQPVTFGFDEFMAYTASKNVSPKDVQIMVPIYDASITTLTSTQQMAALPNVFQLVADWVEYANAPNDGSNPGGGTDWAAMRAANGHPSPYGIEIWNIGNEPWAPGEYTSSQAGCLQYLNDVTPLIDMMLAIDPTIKITLPTVGNTNSAQTWASTILNSSLVSQGKIYGLSQHYFPVEPTTGVSVLEPVFKKLCSDAAKKGIKVFLGDYAHGIPNPTQTEKDLAMAWQGANLSVDFLLLMSQIPNLERVNFWAYGMPSAVWRPIRYNAPNDYTALPAAQLYKKMYPFVLEQSLQTATTSPASTDGVAYSVRSGAFANADLTKINVIAVNRDRTNAQTFQVNGLSGYTLDKSTLWNATSLDSETISESTPTTDNMGNFDIPATGVLVLEYSQNTLGTTDFSSNENIKLYPNPADKIIQFSEVLHNVSVSNLFGQKVLPDMDVTIKINLESLNEGIYFLICDEGKFKFIVKR